MSRIVEFKLGKGITQKVPGSETEHTRKFLELTIRLPEQLTDEGFQDALMRAEYLVDKWLGTPEGQPTSVPQLDVARISELLWTRYSDRARSVKPDEAAWTFSDPSKHGPEDEAIVKDLLKGIEASEGKLRIGNVEFSLSGKDNQFISRRPIKESSSNPHDKMDQALKNIDKAAERMGVKTIG